MSENSLKKKKEKFKNWTYIQFLDLTERDNGKKRSHFVTQSFHIIYKEKKFE